MLAGCKRASHFARVYTLRMVRALHKQHANVFLYQHVDDMSNLVVAQTRTSLVQRALHYAMDFKKWTLKLKLCISSKSVAVPVNEDTKR